LLKKKLEEHEKLRIFYLSAVVHFIKFIFSANFRHNRCLVDPPSKFFYKYRNLANYFSIPLLIVGKYLKKKNIFISVNNECNSSIGHITCEIGDLKRIQKLDDKYLESTIWFTSSRKEILGYTKDLFENENFKILYGGIIRVFLTFVAIKCPSISIDASLGSDNYIIGNKILSNRIIYNNKPKKRARLAVKSSEFHPIREKFKNYQDEAVKLMKELNIKNKFIVIQIKTIVTNSTFNVLNPETYLEAMNYFKSKNYDIVFAGREICPKVFLNYNVINYANSKYASPLNDFLLVSKSSLVISSGSGFCNIAESLDKPILIINSFHGIQQFERRTILLPTLLSIGGESPNAKIQHKYVCTFGQELNEDKLNNLKVALIASSDDIFEAAKELEDMINLPVPPLTPLQKKIRDSESFPLYGDGLSRISDYYLSKNASFFK
jgi:putative glycosyltransferase (TIGR04372 family)